MRATIISKSARNIPVSEIVALAELIGPLRETQFLINEAFRRSNLKLSELFILATQLIELQLPAGADFARTLVRLRPNMARLLDYIAVTSDPHFHLAEFEKMCEDETELQTFRTLDRSLSENKNALTINPSYDFF
jgi:hypothetical protein